MDPHNHSFIAQKKCVLCDSFFNVKVKKMHKDAHMERKQGDCGFDLFYVGDNPIKMCRNTGYMFQTGIAVEMPENLRAIIKTRSSYGRRGLSVEGGVIDSSYRGEIKVVLWNNNPSPEYVEPGDKIAQLLFEYNPNICLDFVENLSETKRGDGGFGSTGN